MKITTGFYVLLICAAMHLINPLHGIASDNLSLKVGDFSKLPKISSVRISPDGNKIISFQNVEDKTFLVSFNLETGEMKNLSVVDNVSYKFRSAFWANNDTVMFNIMIREDTYKKPTYINTVLVRKADASENYRELIKSSHVQARETNRIGWNGNIVSLLRDDPDHVLLAMDNDRAGQDTVYRVNINTGDLNEVQPYTKYVREWLVDQQDRIRAGIKLINETLTILVYDLDKKEWKEVLKKEVPYGSIDEDIPLPIGFGKDPDTLYIKAHHNGKDAIFRADVSKPELSMELIAKDDNYDIGGPIFYSPRTRDAVGVYHDAAASGRIFWDEKYKEFQAAVDRALPDTANYLVDFSDDEQKYIVYSSSSKTPGVFYIGNQEDNSLKIIGYAYPQLMGKLQGSKKVAYNSNDGRKIKAYLTLPGDYKPGSPCSAVVFPHDDPIVLDDGGFDYWSEFFASKGIIVLQPNFHDYSGYGKKFIKEAANEFGPLIKDDLAASVKWLVEQKLADPERIAVAGKGFGGYSSLVGATETPDLFRCAISFAGISDLGRLLQSLDESARYSELLQHTETDNEKLESLSPIEHVDKIKIPILLGHSDGDRTIPVKQSQKLEKELKRKKKVYTYLELEEGDHSLSLQKNRDIFFKAMDEFLDRYLLND